MTKIEAAAHLQHALNQHAAFLQQLEAGLDKLETATADPYVNGQLDPICLVVHEWAIGMREAYRKDSASLICALMQYLPLMVGQPQANRLTQH